ncbi:7788_t:CDS:2 [Diversispora eburnea]|uniref:phenylalanine--tRNA ligase n=1 Tax=Diversispora eburnea TaxID=1213867 RepID=A0A9N8V2C1_9GLOM|nr:7788_t:CDS:2 [Diversispora eburnea]
MYRLNGLNVNSNRYNISNLFIKNKFTTKFYKFITTIPQGQKTITESDAYITDKNVYVEGKLYPKDKLTNATLTILKKSTRRLHLQTSHPISILRTLIERNFNKFQYFNNFSPIVTPIKNFDELGFPENHPGRSTSDSYYINKDVMFRTHTSAHQLEVLKNYQAEKFLIKTEDQIVIGIDNPIQTCHSIESANAIILHLKYILNGLVKILFKEEKNLKVRLINSYFPFTSPSWEMEVFYRGKWLEICGCGVIKQDILNKAGKSDKIGWAFGLGLERIAMILFDIPDIRLFWSTDPRFLNQFKSEEIIKFQLFSKYPSCFKDISFWASDEHEFHENDFCEIVRDVAQDLVEDVKLVDEFVNPKTKKKSFCYRINYRSMDKTFTNEEINAIQEKLRDAVTEKLNVTLR